MNRSVCDIYTLIFIATSHAMFHDRDHLYINGYVGEFPDLTRFVDVRRVFVESSVLYQGHKIPHWIKTVSIERSHISELPALPDGLTRLYIAHTDIKKLPDRLPPKLKELILADNPGIRELPAVIPPELENLSVVKCSVREIPPLPDSIFIFRCSFRQN
jgi:hypothetical protein